MIWSLRLFEDLRRLNHNLILPPSAEIMSANRCGVISFDFSMNICFVSLDNSSFCGLPISLKTAKLVLVESRIELRISGMGTFAASPFNCSRWAAEKTRRQVLKFAVGRRAHSPIKLA